MWLLLAAACCVLQGLGATILRNTPANAVYLGTFEVLKGQAAQQLGCKVRR
jgi:solute carrier family 25 carnitine/acylcarnitine transporter 20/29